LKNQESRQVHKAGVAGIKKKRRVFRKEGQLLYLTLPRKRNEMRSGKRRALKLGQVGSRVRMRQGMHSGFWWFLPSWTPVTNSPIQKVKSFNRKPTHHHHHHHHHPPRPRRTAIRAATQPANHQVHRHTDRRPPPTPGLLKAV
jgi:hypothetical protein